MSEKVEGKKKFKGYWWLPEKEDDQIAGVVTYDPKHGTKLELFHDFDADPHNLDIPSYEQFEVINGITTNGNKICLANAWRENHSLRALRKSVQQLDPSLLGVRYLLIGDHFCEDDLYFKQAKFKFVGLAEWDGRGGIQLGVGDKIGDNSRVSFVDQIKKYISGIVSKLLGYSEDSKDNPDFGPKDLHSFRYERVPPLECKVGELEISFVIKSSSNTSRHQAGIEEEAFIELKSETPIHLVEWEMVKNKLLGFFSLAICRPESTTQWALNKEIKDPNLNFDVSVCTARESETEDDIFHPDHTNFTLKEVGDEIENLLTNWFQKYDELKFTKDLYFSTIFNSNRSVSGVFLSLTQAVESYHRETENEKYVSKKRFQTYYYKLCDEMPDDLDRDFKKHLKNGTFKHANEFSLRKRLKELNRKVSDITQVFPWDFKTEINPIVDTRNFLTHRDKDPDSDSDPDRLQEFNVMLRGFIEVLLLTELGLPAEFIKNKIDRRYQLMYSKTKASMDLQSEIENWGGVENEIQI